MLGDEETADASIWKLKFKENTECIKTFRTSLRILEWARTHAVQEINP